MTRRRSDPGHGSGPPRYPGTFLLAFREALAGLNWQIRRYLGNRVECLDDKGNEQVVGLENLYRRARQVPRENWPALISEFLHHVNVGGQTDDLPTNLADVADQLLPRLGKAIQLLSEEAHVWAHDLEGTDLVINLVIDYPSRMIYVTEKLVEESGRPGAEWLEVALENLRAQTDEGCFETVHEESGLQVCNVADAYDSSRALLLDALLPEGRADGYFVGLPSRDQLFVLPVQSDALAFLFLLKMIVRKEHQTAPYPISEDIFWVHGTAWRRFGVHVEGEQVTLLPPPEFGPVFERLTGDLDEDGEEPSGSEGL